MVASNPYSTWGDIDGHNYMGFYLFTLCHPSELVDRRNRSRRQGSDCAAYVAWIRIWCHMVLFDWNQLVPGIGAVPNIFGFLLHIAASGSLLWFKPCPLQLRSSKGIVPAAFIGWCLTFISIAAILIWFREGVVFASWQERRVPCPRLREHARYILFTT